MEEITPEAAARMNEALEAAMKFVQELYEMEIANRTMEEANIDIKGILPEQLEKLDMFTQFIYIDNLRQNNGAAALKGLQTGIRAAFVYGYILAKLKYQQHNLTPLLQPMKGIVQ